MASIQKYGRSNHLIRPTQPGVGYRRQIPQSSPDLTRLELTSAKCKKIAALNQRFRRDPVESRHSRKIAHHREESLREVFQDSPLGRISTPLNGSYRTLTVAPSPEHSASTHLTTGQRLLSCRSIGPDGSCRNHPRSSITPEPLTYWPSVRRVPHEQEDHEAA